MNFRYIFIHEEACGYVVKILCNRLCEGVRYALSLISSQSSATHLLTALHIDLALVVFFFFKKFISMVKNKNPLNCVCISLIVIHQASLLLVTFAFSVNHTDVSCYYKGCFPTTRVLPLHDSSNLPCNYNTNDLCS